MELEIEKIEIVSADNIQVEVPNEIEISEGKKDYEVSVVKKEYTIIGDSIFIPSMYEDAPPWLKEFIDTTIDIAVTNRDQSLIDRMHSILTAIDYVPKNQYTEQINQIVGEDGIINSRIATLNSNLTDAINSTNATVAEINLTYASKDEAAAIANNVITASLSGSGEIGSALIQLQEAYATLESTTAQSISTLESVMEGEITGNATAMETIRTYVGINEVGASTGTGLSAYLESSDGTIGGADSQLANDVRVTAEGVESKFAYNSIVNINGTYKKSGFGLSTNYTSGNGTQANPYVSEFWIDASRLKFTNSNATGSVAPFTIDATGTTPEITFNGKVAFTNITGTSDLVSTSNIQNAVNNNVTAIDAGKITTGYIGVGRLQAFTVTADRLAPSSGTSTVWKSGGLISNNFNGNAVGSIGSPTQGFRLSANAAGTSSDPNIYGAYIKGATLEGVYFNIGDIKVKSTLDPLKTGKISHSINNGMFVGRDYGSGHYINRVCSSTSQIVIQGTSSVNTGSMSPALSASLQYRLNGGNWVTVDSGRFSISSSSNTVGGAEVLVTLFAILSGSIIPDTGYIEFQITASAPQGGTPSNKWIATVYNQ